MAFLSADCVSCCCLLRLTMLVFNSRLWASSSLASDLSGQIDRYCLLLLKGEPSVSRQTDIQIGRRIERQIDVVVELPSSTTSRSKIQSGKGLLRGWGVVEVLEEAWEVGELGKVWVGLKKEEQNCPVYVCVLFLPPALPS